MEVMDNGNGKEQAPKQEPIKKSHEEYLREFATDLNAILVKGYPLPAIIQVLDSALFEFRMNLYMSQIEIMERQRQTEKRIEIPQMVIPTNKKK